MGQAVTLAGWIGPEEPALFGIKEVNRRLAALGREPA